MTLLEDLQWRGLVADCTDTAALAARLAAGPANPITLYCGFDPTGDSLHVGHLMGQLMLRRFQLAGHHVLPLAGGATGMVGDPSGRSAERNLLTREQLAHNIACIKSQLSRLLDFTAAANPARLVDNADWIAPFSFLEFLRDVGKHFTLNLMLAKDSVKSRLEGEGGISYTEFSYQLLQAYDFYHLCKTYGCELQIGGSDQWGNLTAGTDLIRKKLGHETPAFGWTFPLITKSDGTKFGKTASAGAREAHKALAREVTTIVHGADALAGALKAREILFGGSLDGVTENIFNDVVGEVPTQDLEKAKLDGDGAAIVDLVVLAGLEPSKGA